MDFLPSAAAVAFRAEVRDLIASAFTDEVREQVHETGTIHSWPLHRAIGERGWIAQALPEAQGGGGRDPEELAALFAELERSGAPYDGLSNVVMVSSVLAHVGNEMIRAEVLPRLLSGEPPTEKTVARLGHGGLLTRDQRFRFPSYARELDAPDG